MRRDRRQPHHGLPDRDRGQAQRLRQRRLLHRLLLQERERLQRRQRPQGRRRGRRHPRRRRPQADPGLSNLAFNDLI